MTNINKKSNIETNSANLITIDSPKPSYHSYIPSLTNAIEIASHLAVTELRGGAISGNRGIYGFLSGAIAGIVTSTIDLSIPTLTKNIHPWVKEYLPTLPKNFVSTSVYLTQSIFPLVPKTFFGRETSQNYVYAIKTTLLGFSMLSASVTKNPFDLSQRLEQPLEAYNTLEGLFNTKNVTHVELKKEFNENLKEIISQNLYSTLFPLATMFYFNGSGHANFAGMIFNQAIQNIDINHMVLSDRLSKYFHSFRIIEELYLNSAYINSSATKQISKILSRQKDIIKAILLGQETRYPETNNEASKKLHSETEKLLTTLSSEITNDIKTLKDDLIRNDYLSAKGRNLNAVHLLTYPLAKMTKIAYGFFSKSDKTRSDNISEHYDNVENDSILDDNQFEFIRYKDVIDFLYVILLKEKLIEGTYDPFNVMLVDKMLESLRKKNSFTPDPDLEKSITFVKNITENNGNLIPDYKTNNVTKHKLTLLKIQDLLKDININYSIEELDTRLKEKNLVEDQYNNDDNAIRYDNYSNLTNCSTDLLGSHESSTTDYIA